MKVLYGLERVDPPLVQSVLTIGNFDGVHRAHQQLLAQAGFFAANTGGPMVVLTFEPHPLTVVAPEKAPARLSTTDNKLELLQQAGVDMVVVARSEPGLLALEAPTFVEEVIHKRFHPTHIVEGPSFGFGHNRKGTAELLKELAKGFGCEVHILEPVTLRIDNGGTLMVSSSLIRQLLESGRVHRAALCLGRNYTLAGKVISGAHRGRTLGFPTANLAAEDQLVPGEGVYNGSARLDEDSYPCAISIGKAPTFGEGEERIEAYLLDFDGDLYGQRMRLEFFRRLREQCKFDSPEELTAQVARDVQSVRDDAELTHIVKNNDKANGS